VCDHLGAHEPTVFFEWGPVGAATLAEHCGTIVVVDVLSFTTSVSIVCARGTVVLPSPVGEAAVTLARQTGAILANRRRAVTDEHPWSLSPSALVAAPVAPLLVLPSPNGSAISHLVTDRPDPPALVACSIRNRAATARLLLERMPRPFGVVASGERWPDGSLRPALEDLLGAALVIERLAEGGETLSADAEVAGRSVAGLDGDSIRRLLGATMSAAELVGVGFPGDVALAGELDVEGAVAWQGDGYAGVPATSQAVGGD
jgi:2-phosphosulfolactate phosphatase